MLAFLLLAGAATAPAWPLHAAQEAQCADGKCVYRLTPQQLVAKAEELVLARRFDEARPLLEALEQAPGVTLQRRFLTGYIAVETGDPETAIREFRAILADDPEQTRVRLELARALLMTGKEAAADHHFRLAEEDRDLPQEILRTVRNARGVIRSQRRWNATVDFGLAPDSNINGATDAEVIDFHIGPITIPLQLDQDARRRTGIGQVASLSGDVRLPVGTGVSLLIDAYGQGTNYPGKTFDDYSVQIGAGPELRLDETATVSVQSVAQHRWYGGRLAVRQFGLKAGFQKVLDQGQRIGLQLDGRRTQSGFADAYSGWQFASYAIYERVVRRSFIASATIYLRRDQLESEVYSSTDYGVELGIGGELPFGINAGLSGGIGRALFDAPNFRLSLEKREDLRLNGRAYAGLRSVRLWGFSPSITYTFAHNDTNYDLYTTSRHRLRFNLARYF
jgi:hypothetical protein